MFFIIWPEPLEFLVNSLLVSEYHGMNHLPADEKFGCFPLIEGLGDHAIDRSL